LFDHKRAGRSRPRDRREVKTSYFFLVVFFVVFFEDFLAFFAAMALYLLS
jgi:hypothetical protein